jgi:hypothetical protein
MKQLVHIHGGEWFDSYDDYFAYLKEYEIEDPKEPHPLKWRDRYEEFLGDGWHIIRPQMPSPKNAKYPEWELWFEKYFTYIEDGVVLVGHSLGATFLVQYLSAKKFPKQIHALHLVAPAFNGKGGFGVTANMSRLEENVRNVFIYHSKDDPLVPYTDAEKLRELLRGAELVTFVDKGHLLIPELPELVERIQC